MCSIFTFPDQPKDWDMSFPELHSFCWQMWIGLVLSGRIVEAFVTLADVNPLIRRELQRLASFLLAFSFKVWSYIRRFQAINGASANPVFSLFFFFGMYLEQTCGWLLIIWCVTCSSSCSCTLLIFPRNVWWALQHISESPMDILMFSLTELVYITPLAFLCPGLWSLKVHLFIHHISVVLL